MKHLNPEALGFSAERLLRINSLMNRYVESGKLAGIDTCIFRRGQVVHRETYGYQNLEAKTPLSQDSIFRIYSMTKPIASAALMMLYEDTQFNLTDLFSSGIVHRNIHGPPHRPPLTDPVASPTLLTYEPA